MTRFQIFLCFIILLATVTFFNEASAHVKIKPALPQIGDPTTVNDVESYTVKVVSTFVADLEKECPKTEKLKLFFEKLKLFSKVGSYESDMKAKAGSLFQAMSALGSVKNGSKGGTVNKSVQREKTEAMNTVKMLQSIGGKIASGQNNKTEINGTAKLSVEQQKEIKDGILKWLQVFTRIAKTTEEISLNSAEERDDDRNTRGESKENTGEKGGSEGSANNNNTSGNGVSTKSEGRESNEGRSSKSKGESNEKADKIHQIYYGRIEPKKEDVEQSRNKTEQRLRAEMAGELD